ncbi:MAG: MoxR family ATPase [Gemmatimonadetes bacterium]|nr:MoxR family ATPase [Gemmatimonadota bacterium]
MESSTTHPIEDRIEHLTARLDALRGEIAKRVVGQESAVEEVLLCLLTGGHGLLEGVPGLAKTLLVRTLAEGLSLEFRRVQFTPDLMPGDITGTEVIEEDRTTGRRAVRFLHGPVFTQILLADEINRAPPKTQAALLEAMQEGRVTAGGEDLELPRPFFVLATQNPIEQEGTYPLPEAQLDRFMLKISMGYPDDAEEVEVLRVTTGTEVPEITPVLGGEEVLELQTLVRGVAASDAILRYATRLVRGSRPGTPDAIDAADRWGRWGAGPRAGQALVLCGKARALLRGRLHVAPEDLAGVAPAVLRHRLLLNFQAEADGRTPDDLVGALLSGVEPPRSGLL